MNSGVKLYEFGPFRLDSARRQLLRDGVVIALGSKGFDLLLVLVEHRGQMVSKDDLIKAVWPDTIVVEANLTQQISMVRKALGAPLQDHRYIVTHPGRGYSFAEPISVVSHASQEVLRNENAPALVDGEQLESRHDAAPSNAIREITKTRLLQGESAPRIAADELALRKAFTDRGPAGFWQAIRATVEPGHFGAEDFFAPQIYEAR